MDHWKAIGLAREYVLLKRGERALEALANASPELAETWLWRANALHVLQRYEAAIEAAQHGLAIEAENPYLHHAIARAELMRGRFAEAETAILESLRLNSEDAEAVTVRALILSARGKRDAAAKVIRRAQELAPDLRSVRVASALVTMPRDADVADDLTRALLHQEPEGAHEHWLRGLALLKRYRFAKAATHFARAAALEPDNPEIVRAARVSHHWLVWPLRLTLPLLYWVALASWSVLWMYGLWKPFGYATVFLLYTQFARAAIAPHR